MNPLKEIPKEVMTTIGLVFVFFIIFALFEGLRSDSSFSSPVANASLNAGEEAVQNVFNGWLVVGALGSIAFFVGLVYWFYQKTKG